MRFIGKQAGAPSGFHYDDIHEALRAVTWENVVESPITSLDMDRLHTKVNKADLLASNMNYVLARIPDFFDYLEVISKGKILASLYVNTTLALIREHPRQVGQDFSLLVHIVRTKMRRAVYVAQQLYYLSFVARVKQGSVRAREEGLFLMMAAANTRDAKSSNKHLRDTAGVFASYLDLFEHADSISDHWSYGVITNVIGAQWAEDKHLKLTMQWLASALRQSGTRGLHLVWLVEVARGNMILTEAFSDLIFNMNEMYAVYDEQNKTTVRSEEAMDALDQFAQQKRPDHLIEMSRACAAFLAIYARDGTIDMAKFEKALKLCTGSSSIVRLVNMVKMPEPIESRFHTEQRKARLLKILETRKNSRDWQKGDADERLEIVQNRVRIAVAALIDDNILREDKNLDSKESLGTVMAALLEKHSDWALNGPKNRKDPFAGNVEFLETVIMLVLISEKTQRVYDDLYSRGRWLAGFIFVLSGLFVLLYFQVMPVWNYVFPPAPTALERLSKQFSVYGTYTGTIGYVVKTGQSAWEYYWDYGMNFIRPPSLLKVVQSVEDLVSINPFRAMSGAYSYLKTALWLHTWYRIYGRGAQLCMDTMFTASVLAYQTLSSRSDIGFREAGERELGKFARDAKGHLSFMIQEITFNLGRFATARVALGENVALGVGRMAIRAAPISPLIRGGLLALSDSRSSEEPTVSPAQSTIEYKKEADIRGLPSTTRNTNRNRRSERKPLQVITIVKGTKK